MQIGWIFIIVGVIVGILFSAWLGLILVLIGLALLVAPYLNTRRR